MGTKIIISLVMLLFVLVGCAPTNFDDCIAESVPSCIGSEDEVSSQHFYFENTTLSEEFHLVTVSDCYDKYWEEYDSENVFCSLLTVWVNQTNNGMSGECYCWFPKQ